MVVRRVLLGIVAALLAGGPASAGLAAQERDAEYRKASDGTRILESQTGTEIRVLVEPSNLGGDEVAVAEITFPAGTDAREGHLHEAVEIFYVLSGTLEHVVNGEVHRIEPGMVGIVRPGDPVIHRVPGDEPVRAVVIWGTGTEVERIAPFFQERPGG
ncbi:MAG: cupin domain-containing protein [Gemmatimonadetes bacterium]|nr:cupin domain-containing protein [Gemmatimonadota bacterium]NIR81405.1 cupin domain-containing protein [Gemmatimonadota bacterium]NIT90240.1 cupin domain-containing protein [Gemmatimonadota bacterium]NIU34068.1 cupin domain-containing protein [Gemmatimonadota bacterium]NIU38225.1 cupin domain-containing protein [Gemmatimonadota bacterium]